VDRKGLALFFSSTTTGKQCCTKALVCFFSSGQSQAGRCEGPAFRAQPLQAGSIAPQGNSLAFSGPSFGGQAAAEPQGLALSFQVR
jgi:hypothetical protein